jgi:hypothetical protein
VEVFNIPASSVVRSRDCNHEHFCSVSGNGYHHQRCVPDPWSVETRGVCSGIRNGANTEIITSCFVFVTEALKAKIVHGVLRWILMCFHRLLFKGPNECNGNNKMK